MSSKLLDVLSHKVLYLSDLRFPKYQEQVVQMLLEIDPLSYSIEDWNEAISYIFPEQPAFQRYEEISNFLETLTSPTVH